MCEGCIYFISYGKIFEKGFCKKYLEEKDTKDTCFDEQEKETTSDQIYNTFTRGSYE